MATITIGIQSDILTLKGRIVEHINNDKQTA